MATRREYRHAIQEALNDQSTYLVTSATSSTLTDISLADSTPNASVNRYDGAWVYVATGALAGTQRRVRTGGFAPASGVLTLELTWAGPAGGDEFEITRLFPVHREVPGEETGYHQFIARALALLAVPDRITAAITTSDTYALTTWPWLDRPERLVRVLEPSPVAGRAPVDASWRNPRLVADGPAPFLQVDVPFATATGNLTLEVLRPGDSLISGVESTTGLTTDASTAIPSVEDVRTVALMEVARVMLARTAGRPDGANWERRYDDAREQAERLAYFDRTRMVPPAPSGQEAA